MSMKFKNTEAMTVVFTAQSKQFFYCRDVICEWVIEQGFLPLNPFRVFDYFLGDRVDRDLVRRGNNSLIRLSQELWVFGVVADGVLFEIEYALSLDKTIRFFTLGTRSRDIREVVDLEDVKFEPQVHNFKLKRADLLSRIGAQRNTPQLSLFEGDVHRQDRDSDESGRDRPGTFRASTTGEVFAEGNDAPKLPRNGAPDEAQPSEGAPLDRKTDARQAATRKPPRR